MINRVHRDLVRVRRTKDVDGYINKLPAIYDIIFGLNRPNYAHWGVLFLNQLAKAAPQSQVMPQAEAFSIRRTEKSFSQSAIDFTLEQIVNRDASSSMAGLETIEQPAMRLWVSRIEKDSHQMMPCSMQLQNRVTPSHHQHQHLLAS